MAVELELWACLGKQGGTMTVTVDKTVSRMRNFKLKKTVKRTVTKPSVLWRLVGARGRMECNQIKPDLLT